MASPEVHHLFHHPIADHSFSADRQTLAVARDTSVDLYGRTGNGFKLKDELKGHDKMVTSVDIALQTGRIVTCSQGSFPPSRPSPTNPNVNRPKCLGLGAISYWLQAHSRPPSNQPRCNIRALVSFRSQVRRRIRRKSHCHLLFRRRERLVGLKAYQEANSKHNHDCGMASKLCPLSCRLDRCTRESLF